jgi:hypothetical protein
MVLCDLPPYPYQPDLFLDFVTADGDYARAKPCINNGDIEMSKPTREWKSCRTDHPTHPSRQRHLHSKHRRLASRSNISTEGIVQTTGYNINSTVMAFEVRNGPPVQDTSNANAIQSPEPVIKYPAFEDYDTYQCQAPVYIPPVSIASCCL